MRKAILLTAAGMTALSLAGAGQAQTASDQPTAVTESSDITEIVVTARKRQESLIDVPLSITAVTADQLDKANVDDISDLAMQTPGLSFRQGFGRSGSGQGASNSRPSIRGMSNILGTPNASFFVDGVYVSGNITSYQLDNLQRVEVIKGPQSALYGRQTFSGAVNFVTRDPGDTFEGKLKLTAGQYGHYEASGFVSGPLTDNVFFEINGRSYDFGGDYRNGDNGKRDIGDQQSRSIGGKLVLKGGENFTATFNVGFARDRDKGFAIQLFGSANLNCFLPVITATVAGIPQARGRTVGYYCGEMESPKTYAWNIDEIEARGYDGLDRKTFRSSAKLEYTTDSDWTFTSISAFNKTKNQQTFDNIYQPIPSATFPITSFAPTIESAQVRDISQELRVMTPRAAKVRGLFGAFIYNEDDGTRFSYNYQRNARYDLGTNDGVRNRALFGMIEADFTERFTMSAEARYQQDKIIGTNEASTAAATTPTGVVLPITLERVQKFTAFLPRVTARFEANEDLTVYGSVAKGNKPGGFNDLPTNARPADVAFFQSEGLETFDEESAWNYELGVKGRAFDRRLSFSTSAFYVDWKKQQLTRSEPYVTTAGAAANAAFIQNAGESEIKGWEVDLSGKPASWLFMRFAYTLVNAKFVDFDDENTERIFDTDGFPSFLPSGARNPADTDTRNGQVKGNRLPQTPQHQFVISTEVTQPVAEGMDAFLRSDFAYESKRYVQVDNLVHTGDSYNWNVAVGIERKNWTLQAYVENLLDDRTPLVITRLIDTRRLISIPNGLGGRQTTFYRDFLVTAPKKREIGASLTYRF
ncbi:MAG: TonB-dependent receptor [Alphaproteobacteria bacterium]|nr:TonB-dependent receptor [Alphaproteobacteria bacterium]